jgi:hypothetical protein
MHITWQSDADLHLIWSQRKVLRLIKLSVILYCNGINFNLLCAERNLDPSTCHISC